MPGGSNFRQWYATRARLQSEGRWRGRSSTENPSDSGSAKKPRLESPEGAEEETSTSTQETQEQVSDSPSVEGKISLFNL